MYTDGKLVTAGEKTRLHSAPFGVRTYVPEKCYQGFTLFSPAYGDQEYLIDMRGMLVHTWRVTHSNVAELLPSGNLFTHNCGCWLEELDSDSTTIWKWDGNESLVAPNHHDFWVGDDVVVSLASKHEPVIPGFYEPGTEPDHMRTDMILKINRKKEILWQYSFGEHVEELCAMAGYPIPIPYMQKTDKGDFKPYGPPDWAHANTIEVLPPTPLGEKDTRFKAGNLLFSLRHLDIIGIVDPDKNAIVWCYGPGILDGQHQPTMLNSGNILVFDNGTYRGHSIVREIAPLSGDIVWQYEDGENFFSPFRSGNQRLPNGNTLICECDAGHIFEVTPEKEIVWNFWSPFVAQGRHHLGKRIHRATRYPADAVEPLFQARKDTIIAEVDRNGRPISTYTDLIELYQS
jgi:arylsulfotransferase ASST